MATYKEIKGVTVQTLDSDPELNVGSWSSGGSLNNIRYGAFGFGIQTAAIVATGSSPPFSPSLAPVVEQYNGTSWTEIADVNQTRNLGGAAGTVTEGLIFGGTPGSHNETEDWNGSAWTEVNNLNTGRQQCSGNGTGTAAIAVAGYTTANVNNVETWDGTNWTETTENNTSRRGLFGVGPYTSTIVFGGKITNTSALAETWNGSAWTEVSDLNQARTLVGGSGGSSTDGLAFGGATGPTSGSYANTENWNGSAWTEVADLATARQAGASAGTSTSALFSSGSTDGGSTIPSQSEEWSFPPPTAAILTEGSIFLSGGTTLKGFGKAAGIPAATWASGGALNTARYGGSGFGTGADSGIVAGSNEPAPAGNLVEQYNGTSWTEVAEINTGRYISASGFGSVTAGLIMGGVTQPGGSNTGATESWNGSAWTELNDLNESRGSYASSSSSPYTSGFIAGGSGSPAPAETETWDGTSWTETGDLNTGRIGLAGAGVSSTSGLAFGGVPNRAINESWDGSSWTEVGDLNTGREYLNGAGIQTSALAFAGRTSPPQSFKALNESWDGSSWTEIADLSTTRFQGQSGGVASSAFYAGGEAPGVSSATEEFVVNLANKTITAS